MDRDLERLVSAYLDGVESPADLAQLEARAQTDPAVGRELLRLATQDVLVRAIVKETAVARAFIGREAGAAPEPAGGSAPAGRPSRRGWRRPLALAAGLALAIAGGLWFYPRLAGPAALGLQVAEFQGAVAATRAGQALPVRQGLALRDGDHVTMPAGGLATLKYAGEDTRLALHSATATFRAEQGAKRLHLAMGTLVCTAAPQRQPFRIETPHAVAVIAGTQFSLDVGDAQTTLAVQAGKVALLQGDHCLQVTAGKTATARLVGATAGLAYAAAAPDRAGSEFSAPVLDDFEGRSLELWTADGNKESRLRYSLTSPGSGGSGHALRCDYDLRSPPEPLKNEWGAGRWGALVRRSAHAPEDWSPYAGIAFHWFGRGTGQAVILELRDNGQPGAPGDTWERFVFEIRDDRHGWQEVRAPWSAFVRRRDQPLGAPNDGLNRRAVNSLAFVVYGQHNWFALDELRLFTD